MASDGSVSQWIAGLKDGDPAAVTDLWHRYFEKLIAIARNRLNERQRRVSDEEDVVVSVFDTLCRGARNGQFDEVQNRSDLWRILIVIVRRKVIDRHRKEIAQKRGGPQPKDDLQSMEDLVGTTPTPLDLMCMEEEFETLMSSLEHNLLREVAQLKLEGYRNREVATELDVSVRTVQRKLELIEATWMNSLV